MAKDKSAPAADGESLVAMIEELAGTLTLDQRRRAIVALGNPAASEPAPAPRYEAGKQYRFRLAYQDIEQELVAANETDARARFNDLMKRWPTPKAVQCELLGEVAEVESPIADLPKAAQQESPIADLPKPKPVAEPKQEPALTP